MKIIKICLGVLISVVVLFGFWILANIGLLGDCCTKYRNGDTVDMTADMDSVEDVRHIEYGVDITNLDVIHGRVESGQIITSLMRKLGADNKVINQAVFIPDSIFDVRQMRAGNRYFAYYTQDSVPKLTYLVYSHTQTDFVVFHFEDSLHIHRFSKPTTVKTKYGKAVINSSLWNAIDDADMNLALALNLSDIFAWTVDFFGLQKGDAFKVCYDELFVDSVSIGIDKIYAACFTHAGKNHYALFYENEDIRGYWDLEGNSVKKAFLKAPLSFSRISSHFTYARRHPIYKTVRPHTGVDYAAPMGTPVMSIGDGVVVAKGYQGGGGHTIKIKHNSTYTSAYLHLSKYGKGVSLGDRVVQGQVIGYVGSSGSSTGPHLDFRVWKNGQPVDPLKLESPPTEPIPEKYMVEFDSVKLKFVSLLDSIQ